ncbi:MAG: VWA domain-containing protein [Bacteroidota bacterium]|nr:VWA domain-containing protein [Bacteroidota bacterium]
MVKKYFLILCLAFVAKVNGQLVFQNTSNDYGNVPKAKILFSEFIVTNTGTEEAFVLRLDGVSNFSWSFARASIKPGESDTIRIYYSPDKAGAFNEKIKVYLSTDDKPTVLEMKGNIKEVVKEDPMPCYSFRDAHPDLFKLGVIPQLDALIIDAKTKLPIDGAFFQVYDGSFRSFFGYTKADGAIQYKVSPSLYNIRVSADGHKSKEVEKYLNRETEKFVIELEQIGYDTGTTVAETIVKKVEATPKETAAVKVQKVEQVKVKKINPPTDSVPKKVELKVEPVIQTEIMNGQLNPLFFTPNNIVLLIDVSGSMAKPDRLDLFVKQSHELIEKLRPFDKVSIVVYSLTARILIPPTPAIEKKLFFIILDSLKANGMTNAHKGIELAYSLADKALVAGGNNQIILVTDGVFRLAPEEKLLMQTMSGREVDPIILSVMMMGLSETAGKRLQELVNLGRGSLLKSNEDPNTVDLLLEEIKDRSKKK